MMQGNERMNEKRVDREMNKSSRVLEKPRETSTKGRPRSKRPAKAERRKERTKE